MFWIRRAYGYEFALRWYFFARWGGGIWLTYGIKRLSNGILIEKSFLWSWESAEILLWLSNILFCKMTENHRNKSYESGNLICFCLKGRTGKFIWQMRDVLFMAAPNTWYNICKKFHYPRQERHTREDNIIRIGSSLITPAQFVLI